MTLAQQLREAGEKATPGAWVASEADMFGDHNIQSKDGVENDTDHSAIAAVVSNLRHWTEVEANAALIVLLRNNLDTIIAALEAQEEGE